MCIDITPSYTVPRTSIPGGSKANTIVSNLDFAVSPAAEKVIKLDVVHSKTVGEFVGSLIQHGRHNLLVDGAQTKAAQTDILTQ
ncbi:hypothetical protein N7535_007120 [Penicillium sp. DV-2018c]|nr:hypothetical protein N7461_006785 [Penicillium sp. DV-2018c]KAJ5567814.1 hypothetical protein N7535_007120 [Penicillium sp. DV-2018c]